MPNAGFLDGPPVTPARRKGLFSSGAYVCEDGHVVLVVCDTAPPFMPLVEVHLGTESEERFLKMFRAARDRALEKRRAEALPSEMGYTEETHRPTEAMKPS